MDAHGENLNEAPTLAIAASDLIGFHLTNIVEDG
jgi:hypothetical protein